MPIGIIVEGAPGETRVAATPSSVTQLLQLGYKVFVERGADAGSSFPDADYEAAGAWLVDRKTISAARGASCGVRAWSAGCRPRSFRLLSSRRALDISAGDPASL